MILPMMKKFVRLEAFAGILLGIAAILALIAQNSPLQPLYANFLDTKITVDIGNFGISKAAVLWINDGLMAVFFLLVGLEIKREVKVGQLSSPQKFALPAIAALGGLIFPAIVFYLFNASTPENLNGWAIPTATDIAFALGVILLLGSRVPLTIKVTLVAIAIIDDLAAITIIALFYTSKLSLTALGVGAIFLAIMLVLNLRGVTQRAPYILLGVLLWVAVLKSGVHATLAGVATAFMIPMRSPDGKSPVESLEHSLHPWVAYMILPLFAFANAGVPLIGLSLSDIMQPLPMGITLGLLIGKPLGVILFSIIAIKIGLAKFPEGSNFVHYLGMAVLTGIGFTMSLFIGTLAFDDLALQNAVRLGVLAGSIITGLLGSLIFILFTKPNPNVES